MTRLCTENVQIKAYRHNQYSGYEVDFIAPKDGTTARQIAGQCRQEDGDYILTARSSKRPIIINREGLPADDDLVKPGMSCRLALISHAGKCYLAGVRAA